MVTTRKTTCSGLDEINLKGSQTDIRKTISKLVDKRSWQLALARQSHSAEVEIVEQKGADQLIEGDAMIIEQPDLVLVAKSADCACVLLYHPPTDIHRLGVVGVVHAGWRGLVGGVVKRTVELMGKFFDLKTENIVAGIGPTIESTCYPVGPEVADEVTVTLPSAPEVIREQEGRIFLDISRGIRLQLESMGINEKAIEEANICTRCQEDIFYSYRRDGKEAGRFGLLAWLEE